MTDFGVQPSGFVRKSLAEILSDIEQRNVSSFGAGIIQTSQSPLGNINGLFANVAAELWEAFEGIYQAHDPAQAEGFALDLLGTIRLLSRGDLEESVFRRAIMNDDIADIGAGDFETRLRSLPGVVYARVITNEGTETDSDGIPRNSVCPIVLGGDDDDIALVVKRFVVPGISTYGNQTVSATIAGRCRSFFVVRPVVVPVTVRIAVKVPRPRNGCPAPAVSAIAESLGASFNLDNGEDITEHNVRARLATLFPDVELVAASAGREGRGTVPLPLRISFFEIATVNVIAEKVEA